MKKYHFTLKIGCLTCVPFSQVSFGAWLYFYVHSIFLKIFIINIWLTAFHVGTIPKCIEKNHYFEKLSDFFLSIPRWCKRLIFHWKYIGNNFKTVFHFYDFFGWPKCPSTDVQKLKCSSNIFAEVPFVGFESWYLSTSRQYSKRSMSSKVDNQPNPIKCYDVEDANKDYWTNIML